MTDPLLHSTVPPEQRFWRRVEKGDGCWLWKGRRLPKGYGYLGDGKRRVYAHRFSYELAYGPIAPGLDVCHSCDNPPCVRPDHLFAGTRTDNMRDASAKGRLRSQNTGKTRCKHGHEFTPENTKIYVAEGTERRGCRECGRRRGRQYYHQSAEARLGH